MVEALQCGSILSIPPIFFTSRHSLSSHRHGYPGGVSQGGIHGYPTYFDDIPVFNWLSPIPHFENFETQLISDTRSLNIGISPKDEGEMGCTVTIRGW